MMMIKKKDSNVWEIIVCEYKELYLSKIIVTNGKILFDDDVDEKESRLTE